MAAVGRKGIPPAPMSLRHVWHAVTCISGQCPIVFVVWSVGSDILCFQTGAKETNHLHTQWTHTHTPPLAPLSRCHGQQINDHKAIFSAAQGAMGAMVEIYERDCRPKNYSVHKLLNAKSFDFNYAENFYCQTCGCGCRTRTFPAFPASWQIHRSFSLCSPSPAS